MNKKIIALLLSALFVVFSFGTVCAESTQDVQDILLSFLSQHRDIATEQQEDALKISEDSYSSLKLLAKEQAPWSDTVNILLTDEIKNNATAKRTLELENLRGKTISISPSASQEVADKLSSFTLSNDTVDTDFDLSSVTVSEAAGKYVALEERLTSLYGKFTELCSAVEDEGAVLQVEGVEYDGFAQVVYEDMMRDKIYKLLSDVNSVVFSTKDTYEAAITGLFDDANKKFIGLIFGSDFAQSAADAETTQAVYDYFKGSSVLETVIKYETDLYAGTFAQANTALNSMLAEIFDSILALPSLAGIKSGIEGAGWSAELFISACSTIADAADVNYYTKIINLNMLLGSNAAILFDDKKVTDFKVNTLTAADDEYDIAVSKKTYSASILNIVDTKVYEQDNTESTRVVSEDDNGALKFTLSDDAVANDYTLNVYRGGGTQDVYGYITSYNFDVFTDDTVHVTAISLRQGDEEDIYIDATLRLTYIITPNKATNKAVEWVSSSPYVASVDDQGLVTGKSSGKAVITVTTADGGYSDSITINVKKKKASTTGGTGSGGGAGTVVTPTVTPTPTATATPKPETPQGNFSDLDGHWASDDIALLTEKEYIKGYDDGTFRPDSDITRAEFAVIIVKMMGLAPIDGIVFDDTQEHWAKNYISTACKYSLMIGLDESTFAPDAVITREQVISVILRASTLGTAVVNEGEAVSISGDDVIAKIIEKLGYDPAENAEITLSDIDQCSSWAKHYVEIAYVQGWSKGFEDNTIRPLVNSSRAQAAVMAKRTLLDNE